MVRTKADAYTKAAVKAPRKSSILKGESSKVKTGKVDKYSGGNPYFPRPVPEWQKPITSFFSKDAVGSSGACISTDKKQDNLNDSEVVSCGSEEPIPSCSKDDFESAPCGSKNVEPHPSSSTGILEPLPCSSKGSEPTPSSSIDDSKPIPSTGEDNQESVKCSSEDDEGPMWSIEDDLEPFEIRPIIAPDNGGPRRKNVVKNEDN